MKRIPLTEVYGTGVELDIDERFYEHANVWQPMDDVQWDSKRTISESMRDNLAAIGTQFHYGNMTDLMLCGRILEREPTKAAKRLALVFSMGRMRNVDAWGQYLDLLDATSEITPALETYMSNLYDDANDPLSLLIGMTIIGDVSGSIILDESKNIDDPVLQQMAEHMTRQAGINRESAVQYLKPVLAQTHPNRLTKIRHELSASRNTLQQIIRSQEDVFEAVGINPHRIMRVVSEESEIFLTLIMPRN